MKEKLLEVIEKGVVSKADKALIKHLSMEHGLEFAPKGKCNGCYVDQALVLYKALYKEEVSESPRLREDIDVVIDGHRICNATLTEELIARYRDAIPSHWWV